MHISLVVGLFVVYLVNGLIAIPDNSVTFDEMDHWSYGKRILKIQPEKIYPFDDASAMPVTGFNAIPRAIEQLRNPDLLKTDGGFSDIMNGRYVTLFICLLIGLFVYKWSADLFGEKAGLFSLFLVVLCPNINAHTTLLTTDAYTALLTVSTFYFFWKFITDSRWKSFILFSVSLGAAQLVKQSLLHLFIIFFIVSLVILVQRGTWKKNFKKNLGRVVVLISLVILLINAGFFFNGFGISISSIEPHSTFFLTLNASAIGNLPLPLPEPFVKGTDLVMYMNELGAGHPDVSPKNYLLGEFKKGEGFWNYYLVVSFFKTPLSVLLGLGIVFFFLVRRWKDFPHKKLVLFLVFAVLYFILFFSLFSNSQVGLRHVILVYPLLYVCLGSLLVYPVNRKYVLPVFILYAVFSFYKFFPNLISYHNELIASKNTYQVMADSNIDYGQSYFRYLKFQNKHPEYKIPGKIPEAGKFILPVDEYLDTREQNKFNWISNNFKPDGHFDHCYILFDISAQEIQQLDK